MSIFQGRNIHCPMCGRRHPRDITCDEAKRMADLATVDRLKQASQADSVALYVDDIIAALRDVKPMYEAEGEDGMGTIAWERCVEAIRDIAPSSEKDKFDELV